MGYRNYIGKISIEKYDKIKNLNKNELFSEYAEYSSDGYLPLYKIATELFEMGKYCDLNFLSPHLTPFFSNNDLEEEYNEEQEFKILSKDGFRLIIEDYRKKVISYYEKIIKQDKKDILLNPSMSKDGYFLDKLNTWNDKFYTPYDLSDNTSCIVSSWKYEYAIFELVRIYKSIDFNKEKTVLMGW